MRVRNSMFTLGVGLIVTLLFTAVHGQDATSTKDLKAGEQLFKSKCSLCHGDDGSGNAPAGKALKAKDLRSNEAQGLSDDELASMIKKGKNKMPAFGSLSDAQIKTLVAEVRHLAAK
jgi:mono/diheme cytochrome c family protein